MQHGQVVIGRSGITSLSARVRSPISPNTYINSLKRQHLVNIHLQTVFTNDSLNREDKESGKVVWGDDEMDGLVL